MEGSSPNQSVGEALPLVFCDHHGTFKMDPQAVAALHLLKAPLGVVSICGRARQGKSFILNQLLGNSVGFPVASTHRPCTKGLWMWSIPLQRTALDGTKYSVLLLDTEGVDAYDQTGTYSTQILSLAVLLSSMFVYNQMGEIDEAALDRLSLVTEMTKHIRTRASESRSSVAELGQFSPIFLWLLRDFYLDLTEDGRRITPREYLESALETMPGTGKAIAARNEIRESFRSLFPDRSCFALVRPINDEQDLQHLDKISLERMRPEFRSGLDALSKFIFERTRAKQVGSTVMTGPVLVGLLQSFLDAINAGAVPTIATSWQNVEESECRRAYDAAIEIYSGDFNKFHQSSDEAILQVAHEVTIQNALVVFNKEAVGIGAPRLKYDRMLITTLKRRFEEYKRKAFMEAELKCSKSIESMDEQIRIACHSSTATFDQVLDVMKGVMMNYEAGVFGPTKWKRLVRFLQQSLEGPLSDLMNKRSNQNAAKNSSFQLKCRSLEDRLLLLGKQLDATQKNAEEWKRRYEVAVDEYKSSSEETATRYAALQIKYNMLEEKCEITFRQLEDARREALVWRKKHEHMILEKCDGNDHAVIEFSTLKSRYSAAEARLAAAHEQAESAKEEAFEWRRKHDFAVKEFQAALETATTMHDRANEEAQSRENALRVEFSSCIAQKDMDLKNAHMKIEEGEHQKSVLSGRLKDKDIKLSGQKEELVNLRTQLIHLQTLVDDIKAAAQHSEKELKRIYQENIENEERLDDELKKLKETEDRCKIAEEEAKRASEMAKKARIDAASAEKEKLEVERLVERLAVIEKAERQIQALLREKEDSLEEMDKIRTSGEVAVLNAISLEKRLERQEKEMEGLLQSAHDQRATTVQVLESLLAGERQAHAEANTRAKALSLQLQATQGKLDVLQQQIAMFRLNETTLGTKLNALQRETRTCVGTSHSKRQRDEKHGLDEPVKNVELEENSRNQKKKPKIVDSDNGHVQNHELVED